MTLVEPVPIEAVPVGPATIVETAPVVDTGENWPPVYRLADARQGLPAGLRRAGQKAAATMTSTPYLWKRRYSDDPWEWGSGSLDQFVADEVALAREVWHVTRSWGWFFLNLGDTRANTGGSGGDAKAAGQRVYRQGDCHLEGQQWIGVPWRVANAIQDRTRWRLQTVIVWDKGRSVRTDNSAHHHARNRRAGSQHELVFGFVKPAASAGGPLWDPTHLEALGVRGDVWQIPPKTVRPPWAEPSDDTPPWPDELVRRLVLTCTRPGDRVIDPCGGYGTTARVATDLGRDGLAFDPYSHTHPEWEPLP